MPHGAAVAIRTHRSEGPFAERTSSREVAKLAAQMDDRVIVRLGGSCDPESYGMRFGSP
jgi:hypothetical protein